MLTDRFAKAAQRLGIRSDVCSIVACSGGVDSMTLAALMHDGGFAFRLLHALWASRSDSTKEKELVESWAQTKGLSIRVFDAQEELSDALDKGENLQHARPQHPVPGIKKGTRGPYSEIYLTAHHAQDRLEGLFISLIRGESWRSFCGMPDKTNELARPLLGFTKEEIRSYARSAQLPFLEDRSNDTDAYLRNPDQEPHHSPCNGGKPRLEGAAGPNAGGASALRQLDDGSFERWKNDAVKMLEADIFSSIGPFVLSIGIISLAGSVVTGSHALKALLILLSGSGQQLEFGSHRLQVERDHLLCVSDAGEAQEELFQIENEGKFICADQQWSVCRSTGCGGLEEQS